jgi:ketosteroid isomerase-like protein
MSRHDEVIARLYAAWNEGGPDAMRREFWHGDIVWHDDVTAPDATDHFGAAATERYLKDVIETIGSLRSAVHSVHDTADGALVELTLHAQGQTSGAATDLRVFHLLKIEDDLVTDCRVFFDAEQAQAAARERGATWPGA